MGCVRNFDGNPDQAVPHFEAALRLNPTPASATLQLSDLSLAYMLQGDFESAEKYARQAISKLEANTRAWERLAASLGHQNRPDEARQALEQLTRQQGPLREGYLEMTYPFREESHRALLWEGLRRAGWTG
jgi:Flp pilus assembly protein TadD